LTGLLGGLVSSTAVTLNLSRLSKVDPGLQNSLSAGILMACATMFVRTLLLTSIVNPALFRVLTPGLSLMSLFTYLLALLFWKSAQQNPENHSLALENPFQLAMAIKFGAFLAIILFLSKLLKIYFGDMGTYFLAAASGLADVDPMTLSMAQMSKDGLEVDIAAHAILIAVSVNSAFKNMVAFVTGDRLLGLKIGATLAGAIAVGLMVS
jgi:uncharacterized membrane protein (DUF4010 family)